MFEEIEIVLPFVRYLYYEFELPVFNLIVSRVNIRDGQGVKLWDKIVLRVQVPYNPVLVIATGWRIGIGFTTAVGVICWIGVVVGVWDNETSLNKRVPELSNNESIPLFKV